MKNYVNMKTNKPTDLQLRRYVGGGETDEFRVGVAAVRRRDQRSLQHIRQRRRVEELDGRPHRVEPREQRLRQALGELAVQEEKVTAQAVEVREHILLRQEKLDHGIVHEPTLDAQRNDHRLLQVDLQRRSVDHFDVGDRQRRLGGRCRRRGETQEVGEGRTFAQMSQARHERATLRRFTEEERLAVDFREGGVLATRRLQGDAVRRGGELVRRAGHRRLSEVRSRRPDSYEKCKHKLTF